MYGILHYFIQHSQVQPDLFATKINRRIKDLCKAYNAENKKLGQTGVGMTYESLQSDLSKSNILAMIIESFPWWPDLHGFWRTNPGFNMLPAIADSDQDFEQEALSLFRLGNLATGSDPSSANETDSGLNSFANSSQSFNNNPLLSASDNLGFPVPDTTSSTGGNDFYSSFFNMDLDDTFDTSFPLLPPNLSLQDLPLPNLPLLDLLPAAPVLSQATPPTSTHENVSSNSCQSSTAKGKCAQGSSVAMASERLAKQADELIAMGMVMAETLHDDQARCHNTHYDNKEAERSH
ncbi:hypothetical protein OG21DRAFT_1491936 [Imleria badia]|nr:hypothetical protein OG21DRAFT_1491936 [Imleria badia]